MMNETLKVVIVIPLVFAVAGGLLYQLVRDSEHARWIAWGFEMILAFTVWFPFFLVPYLKKRWGQA